MLIECRCGKKLKVKDSLLGKKIRCPGCAKVLVVEEAGDEPEEDVVVEPTPKKKRPGRAEPESPRKQKARSDDNFDDDDDDDDEDSEDEDAWSPAKKKKGVSLARNLIAGVVLLALIAVGAFILIQKLAARGEVVLEINTTNVEVFVDGNKMDYPTQQQGDAVAVTLALTPGTHQLKVSKDGMAPFNREIEVVSDKTQTIRVQLKKVDP